MFSNEVASPFHCTSRWSLPAPSALVLLVRERRKPRLARQADEQAERAAIRLLGRDAAYAEKVARVRRYQARLRGQLSTRSWQLYLRLEEAEVERWTHAIERVAGWALASRKRARRR